MSLIPGKTVVFPEGTRRNTGEIHEFKKRGFSFSPFGQNANFANSFQSILLSK